jgi:hypothetical protein
VCATLAVVRTAADLFASLSPGSDVDLDGETIVGSDVDTLPSDVTVRHGRFTGETTLYDAHAVVLSECSFDGGHTNGHRLLGMLGGTAWQVVGCTFTGGIVASQLGVGLSRGRGVDAVPFSWAVERCTFAPLAGQWGTYPQGHNVYVLTSPRWEMGGVIDLCTMSGSPFGAALKLGGTGNQPRTEGIRGVVCSSCDITGVLDGAGRALAVLTQGARTEVELRQCTLRATDAARPTVQAMDGAMCRLLDPILPDGVITHATWYRVLGLWRRETTTAVAGRPRGGVRLD